MAGAKVIQPVTLKFTPSRPALYLERSSPCLHRGPTFLTLTSVHLSPLVKGSPDHQALHTPTRHYLIFFRVSIFSWNSFLLSLSHFWQSDAPSWKAMMVRSSSVSATFTSVHPFLRTLTEAPVQFNSVAHLCPNLCDPMDCRMPGFPEHAQTHDYQVGDVIQPSHPPSSSPPEFNFSQHQGLFQWVSSSYQVAKVLELQFQHQSFQWIFRTDFL